MAVAANSPPVYATEQPETTWERYKNYGQITTVVLEARNIATIGQSVNIHHNSRLSLPGAAKDTPTHTIIILPLLDTARETSPMPIMVNQASQFVM